MITPLQDYEKACNRLRDAFIRELYPDTEDKLRILHEGEGSWIGDAVGEIYSWWDWFVDTSDMANYFKFNFTPEMFFDWYDEYVSSEGKSLNMEHYAKLSKTKKL